MVKPPPSNSRAAEVRQRLLEAADRLFCAEGIRAVGIDRVLSEAGAAKASLYTHFGCKDELIAAHVHHRTAMAREQISAYVERFPPSERALRFFDWVIEWAGQSEFRGCPLQHVVAELPDPQHPARRGVTEQRQWLHEQFSRWAADAGCAQPESMADAMQVLFDGAIAAAERDGTQRTRDARWMAEQLLNNAREANR